VLASENLDLNRMAVAAFVFTILGATGIMSISVLLSMTLAVVSALSLFQIRSRRRGADSGGAASADPLFGPLTDFPDELARALVERVRPAICWGVNAPNRTDLRERLSAYPLDGRKDSSAPRRPS
jgi:hypothetical protein